MRIDYLKHTKINVNNAIFIIIVLIFILPLLPYMAKCEASEASCTWNRVNIPRQGDTGGWVLAKDTDITDIILTDNHVIYCSVNGSGAPSSLFKSTDNGSTWRYTGAVTDTITDLSSPPGKPDTLIYTEGQSVFISNDNGVIFQQLPALPVDTHSGNITISSIETMQHDNITFIIAGTRDADTSRFGGIYILTYNGTLSSWQDTELIGFDVCSVAFSPDYPNPFIMAVVTDEKDTLVMTKNGKEAWNQSFAPAIIQGIDPVSAVLAVPDETQSHPEQLSFYIGLDSGNGTGDAYRMTLLKATETSNVTDLNTGAAYGLNSLDVTSLSLGSNSLFAGDAASGCVYYSHDSGQTWVKSLKPPTGSGHTLVVPNIDYASNGLVYSATSGPSSALSRSEDGGHTFKQISLIDSVIGPDSLQDFAPSPQYEQDGTFFLVTTDTAGFESNVWKSTCRGLRWERITNRSLNDSYIRGVSVPADYSRDNPVLYLFASSNGNTLVEKSLDNGRTFSVSTLPVDIDTWNVIDSTTVYVGGCRDFDIVLYSTEDGGATWSLATNVGNQSLSSVQRSPDYGNDSMLMIANTFGWVYLSDDAGVSYRPLPLDAAAPPFHGNVKVCFDNDFTVNKTVYAVSDADDEGIYRYIIGRSETWEKLDRRLVSDVKINGVTLAEKGAMYAVNTAMVNTGKGWGGVERSLNPSTSSFLPTFETLLNGLDDGITLNGLWVSGNYLWSFDTTGTRLLEYQDSLTQPVSLVFPIDAGEITDFKNVKLDWEVLQGATEYEWQLDYDGLFASLPSGYSGYTGASSVILTGLEPDTCYYWRVRAVKPALSPWSERRNFVPTKDISGNSPILTYPAAGAELSNTKPLFQWNAMNGIKKYDLMVARDPDFKSTVIKKTSKAALSVNAWYSDIELENGQTYYWKVRGDGQEGYTDWSAISAFIIAPAQSVSLPAGQQSVDMEKVPVSPVLYSPGIGSEPVACKPLFQWEALTGAEGYELLVSDEPLFQAPVIIREGEHAVPVAVWRCNVRLEPDTAYYWKVRAVTGATCGEWSPVSAFIVETPEENPEAGMSDGRYRTTGTETDTPASANNGLPEWVVYVNLGLQVATILLMAAVLVVLILTRPRKPFQL